MSQASVQRVGPLLYRPRSLKESESICEGRSTEIDRRTFWRSSKGVDKLRAICEIKKCTKCGCGSVVERHLAKVNVARSNRVTRFLKRVSVSLGFKDFLDTFLYLSGKSVRAVVLAFGVFFRRFR